MTSNFKPGDKVIWHASSNYFLVGTLVSNDPPDSSRWILGTDVGTHTCYEDELKPYKEEADYRPQWINDQLMPWLARFKSYEEFDSATRGAAASGLWLAMAYAMAAIKWNVRINHIPR